MSFLCAIFTESFGDMLLCKMVGTPCPEGPLSKHSPVKPLASLSWVYLWDLPPLTINLCWPGASKSFFERPSFSRLVA